MYKMKIFDLMTDIDNMSLETPYSVNESTSFSPISIGKKPLYIQFPLCQTKQGIVKTNHTKFCDLVFETSNNDRLSSWVMNFEKICQEQIFRNKDTWFNGGNDITIDDIEHLTSPILRLQNSGGDMFIRTYIDSTKKQGDLCSFYDHNERKINIDSINEDSQLVPLVFIEGIRLNTKSFEVKIKLVQAMMIQREVNVDSCCLIKTMNKLDFTAPEHNHIGDKIQESGNDFVTAQKVNYHKPSQEKASIKTLLCDTSSEKHIHCDNELCSQESKKSIDDTFQDSEHIEKKELNCLKREDCLAKLSEIQEVNFDSLVVDVDSDEKSTKLERPREIYLEKKRKADEQQKDADDMYRQCEQFKKDHNI